MSTVQKVSTFAGGSFTYVIQQRFYVEMEIQMEWRVFLENKALSIYSYIMIKHYDLSPKQTNEKGKRQCLIINLIWKTFKVMKGNTSCNEIFYSYSQIIPSVAAWSCKRILFSYHY